MPRTAAEFAEYFSKSPIAQLNRDDMARYKEIYVGHPALAEQYRKSALAEHAKHTRNTSYDFVFHLYRSHPSVVCSPYTFSIPMQTRAVMKRRVQILLGNKLATVFMFG
jgi:ATP-binding cassette subfamily G (WHITE) protein 2 (SNQ2)